jgi:hypothetical protein
MQLNEIRIVRQQKLVITTYADDVTVFLSTRTDCTHLQAALQCYERATGAHVNLLKSKALALGSWDPSIPIMGIPYTASTKILRIVITPTLRGTSAATWDRVTSLIKTQAIVDHVMDLNLAQRI